MHHSIHPSLNADFKARQNFLLHTENTSFLGQLIDSTLLKTNATRNEFLKLFEEANKYLFRSVCVPPCYVSLAKECCKNVLVCTVVGFPNGYHTTQSKVREAEEVIGLGADEIDFVQNINFVKSNAWQELETEYQKVVKAAKSKLTKLILETSFLTNAEIERCTRLAADSGVDIIKTSTGFGSRGANENDIQIIYKTLKTFFGKENPNVGIKASGGVRTFSDALKMIELGATRIGTSNGSQMILGN